MRHINKFEAKQIAKLFWSKKIFVILIIIMFVIIGITKVKYFTTPEYEANGKLICIINKEELCKDMPDALSMLTDLEDTYVELIKSDLVVEQVIKNLGLNMTPEELSKNVKLLPITKVYYKVIAKSLNNEEASKIANEFMNVFTKEVNDFYHIDTIQIVDNAKVPQIPSNTNLIKTIKVFVFLGFIFSIIIIVLIFVFNNTVTSNAQLKKYTSLKALAEIPKYMKDEELIQPEDSESPHANSIKMLKENLENINNEGNLQVIGITSSLISEGKSWVTANLAVSLAGSGKKVLIIDADMQKGRQYKIFGVKRIPGLSDFLRMDSEYREKITIKNITIKNTGMAKILSKINSHIKIEKIPAIYNTIYKEEYILVDAENSGNVESLKTKIPEETIELELEPAKKTRKRTSKKVEEKNEKENKKETKSSSKKATAKKTEKQEKVAKKSTKKSKKAKSKIFEFINKTEIENLDVLPAGRENLESTDLSAIEKLENALDDLKTEYDIILIDTPSISFIADGLLISRIVDTNIIVSKHGNTEIKELEKIKNNIEEIGGNIAGAVINKVPIEKKKSYKI